MYAKRPESAKVYRWESQSFCHCRGCFLISKLWGTWDWISVPSQFSQIWLQLCWHGVLQCLEHHGAKGAQVGWLRLLAASYILLPQHDFKSITTFWVCRAVRHQVIFNSPSHSSHGSTILSVLNKRGKQRKRKPLETLSHWPPGRNEDLSQSREHRAMPAATLPSEKSPKVICLGNRQTENLPSVGRVY